MKEPIVTIAVSVLVSGLIFFALSRWIGKVRIPLQDALWACFACDVVMFGVSFCVGWLLYNYMGAALLIILAIKFVLQLAVFSVAVRAKSQTLKPWIAALISVAVILSDFFVTSPIMEWLISIGVAK